MPCAIASGWRRLTSSRSSSTRDVGTSTINKEALFGAANTTGGGVMPFESAECYLELYEGAISSAGR